MFARRPSMFALALLAIAIAIPLPAAAIFFTPAGSQVDSDPILDIQTRNGFFINFSVFVDTGGLKNGINPLVLSDISYTVAVDTNELKFISMTADPDGHFTKHPKQDVGTALALLQDLGRADIGVSGEILKLATFTYQAQNLDNDGVFDFKVGLGFALAGGFNVTNQFTVIKQEVEVQPNPEPGTCALIGTGLVAVGFRARKKLKHDR